MVHMQGMKNFPCRLVLYNKGVQLPPACTQSRLEIKMALVVPAALPDALTDESINTTAKAVEAGNSVQGSTIASMVMEVNRSVVCGIELSNVTMHFLKTEGYFAAWGNIKTPPASVSPGVKEAMVAYKSTSTPTGTTGFAVWKIGDTDIRLVIMWSIPWFRTAYGNVLAVGFKEGEVKLENDLYREMYFEDQTWFQRRRYAKDGDCRPVEIFCKNEKFKSQGMMGTDDKCEVKVELLPLTKDAVAEKLRY